MSFPKVCIRFLCPAFKCWVLALLCSWLSLQAFTSQFARGQQPSAVAESSDPLAQGQQEVAGRFSRLEELLLRSAELEAAENPTRAALLQQAVQLSKQAQLSDSLAKAAVNLEQKQYSQAIEQQKASRENLKRLLELLQSENREERVREKRDQVRRWIEETDRLLRLQSSLRGRTEGGQDARQAAGDQGKLAQKAADISSDLKGPEQAESQAEDSKSDATETSEGSKQAGQMPGQPDESSQEAEPAQVKPSDAAQDTQPDDKGGQPQETQGEPRPEESGAGKPSADESSKPKNVPAPADTPPAEGQKPGKESQQPAESPSQPEQGQHSEGQPSQGESQPGQTQPPGSPAQSAPQPPVSQDPTERAKQRIEQAQQRMKEAQADLEQAQREGAIEKQLAAENDLREAIQELEEILRQLREEEIERSLASLETRIRKMLEMESKVLEETERLQEISGEQAVRQVEIRASSLARDQRKVLTEGERAYLLLRDEGSSAAFPEAISQINIDMAKVAARLEAADVGPLTVLIEQEIVSSLEEMVAALVQVQKDNKDKAQQKQQGQPQQGQPGEQPLVDKLAELRLIRTLQVRINNRTEALSKMLEDPADVVGQAKEGEVLKELFGLSEREASLQTVTRDIVVGKGE